MKSGKPSYSLVLFATFFAVVVVILGAWTRLEDAGLGCPDWPGCYGFITVPETAEEIARAEAAYPDAPFEAEKAWPEVIHRYFASTLGLLIVIINVIAWKKPEYSGSAIQITSFSIVHGDCPGAFRHVDRHIKTMATSGDDPFAGRLHHAKSALAAEFATQQSALATAQYTDTAMDRSQATRPERIGFTGFSNFPGGMDQLELCRVGVS